MKAIEIDNISYRLNRKKLTAAVAERKTGYTGEVVYVPRESLKEYKTQWREYARIIKPYDF